MAKMWIGVLVIAILCGIAYSQTVQINAGLIPDGENIILFEGELSPSVNEQLGLRAFVTSAGSGAGAQYGSRLDLLQGYTGTGATYGRRVVNAAEGQGSNLNRPNVGIGGVSHGPNPFSKGLDNVGVEGQARWAERFNIGTSGFAFYTNGSQSKLGQLSIGIFGHGFSDATGKEWGGVFTLGAEDPILPQSATLVADTMGRGAPVFIAANRGEEVFRIGEEGSLTTQNKPGLTHTVVLPGCNLDFTNGLLTGTTGC